MKTRAARVALHGRHIGVLQEDGQGYIELRLDSTYHDSDGERSVLGQWFEDHPRGIQRGERTGDLPAFFANVIPEGDLGLILRDRLGVADGDDFGLLLAVGDDLPGAAVVTPLDDVGEEVQRVAGRDVGSLHELRFSLAGVQLKFSMVRHGERFLFPGRDRRGDWIAKIALPPFYDLPRNEHVTMTWARRIGFQVPECELRALGDLIDVPYEGDPHAEVFVVRRFDRELNTRIHQEDFQQIVGRPPKGKYDDITYEQLVLLAMNVVGEDALAELVRRLVFVVASGNDDAHTKNWSVCYPDRIHARLTPLYDQVFTGQWPDYNKNLALKLGGTKSLGAIDLGRFRMLARRVGAAERVVERIVTETLEESVAAWQTLRAAPEVSPEYRGRLAAHWAKVPVLASYAARI